MVLQVMRKLNFYYFKNEEIVKLKILAVDGAFGSYSEASGGRLASLAPPPSVE